MKNGLIRSVPTQRWPARDRLHVMGPAIVTVGSMEPGHCEKMHKYMFWGSSGISFMSGEDKLCASTRSRSKFRAWLREASESEPPVKYESWFRRCCVLTESWVTSFEVCA